MKRKQTQTHEVILDHCLLNYFTVSIRYARQACIIGSSNLSRKQVDSLIDETTDDAEIKSTLSNTDVLLSLNKKQRWRVPARVSYMIRSGEFSNTGATVSMLERHKLKRRANCVNVASSKWARSCQTLNCLRNDPSHILPRYSKYFSYSLDHVQREESRRQTKRRIAEELRNLARAKKLEKQKTCAQVKTVEVFTIEGRDERSVTNIAPVYNLEVYYPCPKTCSLTFNPKYTDVRMTPNDNGEIETRSNVRNRKRSTRKNRKRFSTSDFVLLNAQRTNCEGDVARSG